MLQDLKFPINVTSNIIELPFSSMYLHYKLLKGGFGLISKVMHGYRWLKKECLLLGKAFTFQDFPQVVVTALASSCLLMPMGMLQVESKMDTLIARNYLG